MNKNIDTSDSGEEPKWYTNIKKYTKYAFDIVFVILIIILFISKPPVKVTIYAYPNINEGKCACTSEYDYRINGYCLYLNESVNKFGFARLDTNYTPFNISVN